MKNFPASFLVTVAIIMIVYGLVIDFASDTVWQAIHATLIWCSGWLMLSAGFILEAIQNKNGSS